MRFISALRDACSRSADHLLSDAETSVSVTKNSSKQTLPFSVRRLARVRPSVVLTVTALVVPCLLLVGYGQTGRRNNALDNAPRAANFTRFSEGAAQGIPGVSLKVERGTDAMTVYVGQIPKPMAGFSGKLEGSPATTAECRLGGADRNTSWASPKWVWTYDLQGGPEGNGSGGSYSPTPPAPTPAPGVTPTPTPAVTPKPTPDNGSPSGGAYLSFTQPGTYTITATANLTYSASCVEGEMPDTTSTSATSLPLTITVLPAPTPTSTPEGGTTDGGTTDGGTTDGGTTDGGTTDGGTTDGGTTDGGTTDGGTTDGGTTDGGTTDGGTTDGGTTDGGTTDGGTTDGGGTTGGEPGACDLDPYKHATWTAFGTLTWTADAEGKMQPSVTDSATEMRTAFGQSPRYDEHSYYQVDDYEKRVNGILRRFVTFRADATCSTNFTESTWLYGSIALEDEPSGRPFGSASFKVLKQVEDNTTDPDLPTKVYVETKADVEGQVFVALDLSSSGVNEGQATIRLRETKTGLAETESHIDVPISLSNPDGWQKFYDPDKDDPQGDGPKEEAWWPAPDAPQGHEGHYRYLLSWSTANGPWIAQRITFSPTQNDPDPDGVMVAGKLWNHNGGHKVSLSSVNKKETSKLTFGTGADDTVSDKSVTLANPVPGGKAYLVALQPNGQVAKDATGGAVKVALVLDLDKAPVSSTSATIRILEKPDTEHGVTHPESENHRDIAISFTSATDWQKYVDPDGNGPQEPSWVTAPEAPKMASTTERTLYRYLIPWNTAGEPLTEPTDFRYDGGQWHTGKLWNHNGSYELTISSVDGTVGDTLDLSGGNHLAVMSSNVDVNNIVINDVSTNNGTSDYFKYDPEAIDGSDLIAPTVSFKIEDNGDFQDHAYRWRVRVRSTDRSETVEQREEDVVYEGVVDKPGSVTVEINKATLALDTAENSITRWGTYAFDISVYEYPDVAKANLDKAALNNSEPVFTNSIDKFSLRSTKLFIPYFMPAPNGTKAGHKIETAIDGQTNTVKWYFDHYFQDISQTPAVVEPVNNVKIDILPPDLSNVLASPSLTSNTNTPYFAREGYSFSVDDLLWNQEYIGTTVALDNHKNIYRDHKNHSILSKNGRPLEPNSIYGFTGQGRACAGGSYSLGGTIQRRDEVHIAHLVFNAKNPDLTPSVGSDIKFSLPAATIDDSEGARFVIRKPNLPTEYQSSTITVTTDANGQAAVDVLSCRKVAKIRLKVEGETMVGAETTPSWHVISNYDIEFAAPESKRLFGGKQWNDVWLSVNENSETTDTGWDFNPPVFTNTTSTPQIMKCRLFLRFRRVTNKTWVDDKYFTYQGEPVRSMDIDGDGSISETEWADVSPRGTDTAPLLKSTVTIPDSTELRPLWSNVNGHVVRIRIDKASIPNEIGAVANSATGTTVSQVAWSPRVVTFTDKYGDNICDDTAAQGVHIALPDGTAAPQTLNVKVVDGVAEFYLRAGVLNHRTTRIDLSATNLSIAP